MTALSIETLFDAAVKIQVQEQMVLLSFTDKGIQIRFPTTRRLAEFLEVPHYYILPYFATMEQEELVTRAERVGIFTTEKGSARMVTIMKNQYGDQIRAILGEAIFNEIMKKCQIL